MFAVQVKALDVPPVGLSIDMVDGGLKPLLAGRSGDVSDVPVDSSSFETSLHLQVSLRPHVFPQDQINPPQTALTLACNSHD